MPEYLSRGRYSLSRRPFTMGWKFCPCPRVCLSSLSRRVLSGVMALAAAASAREEKGQGE